MKLSLSRFSRTAAWMLAAAMLCAVLFSGAALAEGQAETAETTENNDFEILENLLEILNENSPEDRELTDQESINEYCLALYGYIDQDKVQTVFYGGPEEAAELLKSLNAALFGDVCSDTTLFISEYYYVYVWSILHADISEQYKAGPSINEIMRQEFNAESSDIFADATNICFDYIYTNEPELALSGYNMNSIETTIEGRSEEFIEAYREGVSLFDKGMYAEAIEAYSRCLTIDENDVLARFEIAEAYIAMRDYDQAAGWLTDLTARVSGDDEKARLLRRLGFIEIEKGNYEAAAALYTYSLEFEENDLARNELGYIASVAPSEKEFTAVDAKQFVTEEYGFIFEE